MPRILVADDNSNIHRAVALALKEAGVEVVAVGNGEAAVRKIAEIKPDLVLADIFMPVRSGYEVCEFVKQDPRFSQVPVVLLIGAFDPFDEREAQRVQADAILKKPFMPPDSLMRTVADLLAQTASRVAQANAAAPAPQTGRSAAPKPPSPAPAPEYLDEAPEDVAPAKARIEWSASEQPVAFGALLETPGAEPEAETNETDAVLTSRRDPNLGEPGFWAPKAKQEQEDESGEPETEPSGEEPSAGLVDEEQLRSAGALEELVAQTQAIPDILRTQSLEQSRTGDLGLPGVVSPTSEWAVAPIEAARKESQLPAQLPELPELPELPTLDLSASAARQIEPPPPPVSKAKVEEPGKAAPATEEQESLPDLNDFAWAKTDYAEPQPVASAPEAVEEIASESEDELIEAAKPGLATLAPFLASLTSAAPARGTGASEAFELEPAPAPPSVSQTDPELELDERELAGSLSVPATPPLDAAVIEAIAQRVIERMQPKIIELVTRELLRPAVEALVQRELEKK